MFGLILDDRASIMIFCGKLGASIDKRLSYHTHTTCSSIYRLTIKQKWKISDGYSKEDEFESMLLRITGYVPYYLHYNTSNAKKSMVYNQSSCSQILKTNCLKGKSITRLYVHFNISVTDRSLKANYLSKFLRPI